MSACCSARRFTELGDQAGPVEDATGPGDPDGGFGPHVLRHTFATELIRGGADLVPVVDLLGHASVDTLRVYTAPNDTDRTHDVGPDVIVLRRARREPHTGHDVPVR